eukprot:m.750553 g.750553  ORF g.750553 m.750553 type:complete len:69 (-) comp23160_c0_seq1:226-432(-)
MTGAGRLRTVHINANWRWCPVQGGELCAKNDTVWTWHTKAEDGDRGGSCARQVMAASVGIALVGYLPP